MNLPTIRIIYFIPDKKLCMSFKFHSSKNCVKFYANLWWLCFFTFLYIKYTCKSTVMLQTNKFWNISMSSGTLELETAVWGQEKKKVIVKGEFLQKKWEYGNSGMYILFVKSPGQPWNTYIWYKKILSCWKNQPHDSDRFIHIQSPKNSGFRSDVCPPVFTLVVGVRVSVRTYINMNVHLVSTWTIGHILFIFGT
jgi:hypothetical protein